MSLIRTLSRHFKVKPFRALGCVTFLVNGVGGVSEIAQFIDDIPDNGEISARHVNDGTITANYRRGAPSWPTAVVGSFIMPDGLLKSDGVGDNHMRALKTIECHVHVYHGRTYVR
jgi:hypothetical protein